jgi:hypothetical protein
MGGEARKRIVPPSNARRDEPLSNLCDAGGHEPRMLVPLASAGVACCRSLVAKTEVLVSIPLSRNTRSREPVGR